VFHTPFFRFTCLRSFFGSIGVHDCVVAEPQQYFLPLGPGLRLGSPNVSLRSPPRRALPEVFFFPSGWPTSPLFREGPRPPALFLFFLFLQNLLQMLDYLFFSSLAFHFVASLYWLMVAPPFVRFQRRNSPGVLRSSVESTSKALSHLVRKGLLLFSSCAP